VAVGVSSSWFAMNVEYGFTRNVVIALMVDSNASEKEAMQFVTLAAVTPGSMLKIHEED